MLTEKLSDDEEQSHKSDNLQVAQILGIEVHSDTEDVER